MNADEYPLNLVKVEAINLLTPEELRSQLFAYAQAFQQVKEHTNRLERLLTDFTAQRDSEIISREIDLNSQLSLMEYKNTSEAVMVTNCSGEILSVNHVFTEITGYTAEEVIGNNPSLLNSGKQDDEFYQVFWQSLRETGTWNGRLMNRRKNGEIYTEWLSISATRDSTGNPLNYIAIFSDVSKLLTTEKRLAYLAYHDSLTDLPNRHLLQERLDQMLSLSIRSNEPFTLVLIDLDGFKSINDTYGHPAGDQVLKEAAKRLAKSVRESDTVARFGGDEFVILAPGLSGDDEIVQFCNKTIQALLPAIMVDGTNMYIGASFGCAEYARHGKDSDTLFKHADISMYRAKLAGGNRCSIYHSKESD